MSTFKIRDLTSSDTTYCTTIVKLTQKWKIETAYSGELGTVRQPGTDLIETNQLTFCAVSNLHHTDDLQSGAPASVYIYYGTL